MTAMQKKKKIENPLEVELVAVLHCQNFSHEEQKNAYILEGFFFFTYSGVFNKNPIFGYVNSSTI